MPQGPIGILGGTFDPVHNGHLRLAIELRDQLTLAEVRLIPCARPPHRDEPVASPGQRAKWIRVAIADEPGLRLDDRELLREGPSYTVDTLASLRKEHPDTPLCLIMGMDVFAGLPDWQDWQRLFDYCHIVLVSRPDADPRLPASAQAERERRTAGADALRAATHGAIHVCEPPPLAISASRVRALLSAGNSPRYLIPDAVFDDIADSDTYRDCQTNP